ncbi:MAG: ABC transporter ATP-binding protein [Myxococcota bacterium]
MPEPMVEALGLRREWAMPSGPPLVAVDDLSFTVGVGEVFGLLGANGAGKSTTLRMLATLTAPSSGTARVAGHDVVADPTGVRGSLGYLSASSGLPTRVTCREVLELFAGLHRVARPAEAVERAIGRFGITEFADRRIESLSTGMRQRVRIATAAIHQPPVLILDEPTAGLDVVSADRLLDSITEARARGTTVIFSTHVLREASRICDRIGIVDQGKLLAIGTPAEWMERTGTSSFDDAFVAMVRR